MSRTDHPRPPKGANPALAEAMREKRRSNAAGTHADRRTRRQRSRAAARNTAIREAS